MQWVYQRSSSFFFAESKKKNRSDTSSSTSSYHYEPSRWNVSSADGSLTTGMSGSVSICRPSKSMGPSPALRASSGVKKSESNEPHMFDIAHPSSLAKSCLKIGSSPPGAGKRRIKNYNMREPPFFFFFKFILIHVLKFNIKARNRF